MASLCAAARRATSRSSSAATPHRRCATLLRSTCVEAGPPLPLPCPPQLLLGGKSLGTAYRASLVGLLLCKLSITYQYFVYIFVFYATDVLFMCDKIPSPSLSLWTLC